MADLEESILTALRRHVAQRREDIASKFPRKLDPREYDRHCGRAEEIETLAKLLQDTVRKANSAAGDAPDDEPDD